MRQFLLQYLSIARLYESLQRQNALENLIALSWALLVGLSLHVS